MLVRVSRSVEHFSVWLRAYTARNLSKPDKVWWSCGYPPPFPWPLLLFSWPTDSLLRGGLGLCPQLLLLRSGYCPLTQHRAARDGMFGNALCILVCRSGSSATTGASCLADEAGGEFKNEIFDFLSILDVCVPIQGRGILIKKRSKIRSNFLWFETGEGYRMKKKTRWWDYGSTEHLLLLHCLF